jgi:hypothetical protein
METKNRKLKPLYICLSGAGINGISFLGTLNEVDLSKVEVFVGSSAGGIICSLLNIGYTPNEIYKIVYTIDLSKYLNINIDNLLEKYGFDNMTNIHKFFIALLKQKIDNPETITFKDLYEKTKKTLVLTGSCINTGKIHYFNHKKTPNMPIIIAMKITMAYVGIFAPIKYNNFYYFDGAFFNYFPVNYIINNYDLTKKNNLTKIKEDYINTNFYNNDGLLGLAVKMDEYKLDKIDDLIKYIYGIYIGISKNYSEYMLSYTSNKKLNISSNKNKNNTPIKDSNGHIIYIYINHDSISNSMNLKLNNDDKKKLYDLGRKHLLKYLFNPI